MPRSSRPPPGWDVRQFRLREEARRHQRDARPNQMQEAISYSAERLSELEQEIRSLADAMATPRVTVPRRSGRVTVQRLMESYREWTRDYLGGPEPRVGAVTGVTLEASPNPPWTPEPPVPEAKAAPCSHPAPCPNGCQPAPRGQGWLLLEHQVGDEWRAWPWPTPSTSRWP